jgi:hypothetical protein
MVRRQLQNESQAKISDDWRALTQAAHSLSKLERSLEIARTIEQVASAANPDRVRELIERGLRTDQRGHHDWPPIINLSEAKGYFFAKGSAELTAEFEKKLGSVVIPQLRVLAEEYAVNTIEAIGHTDEQAIVQRFSNLDAFILDVLNRDRSVANLIPADNAGLGLARAVSVVHALRLDPRLQAYSILPLSGGQLINTNDKTTIGGGGDAKERRRIEIRLRRSNFQDRERRAGRD